MTIKDKKDESEGGDSLTKQQKYLRKKVTILMKQQKLHEVRKIVKAQDDSKSWGQDDQAKVLSLEVISTEPSIHYSYDGVMICLFIF